MFPKTQDIEEPEVTMDYKPPACSRCGYRLPMTWIYKTEMYTMMRTAGWRLGPVLCPDCRRKRNGSTEKETEGV
jgi:DNA-directed RNA polymerase subunit RPC12/RpoP